MCCNIFVLLIQYLVTGYIHYTFLSYRLQIGPLTLGGSSSMTWMYMHIDVFPSSPLTVALPKSCVLLCMSTESRLLDQSAELLLESIPHPPHLPHRISFTRTQLPVFAPIYLSIVFLSSEDHCLVFGRGEGKRQQMNKISETLVCIRQTLNSLCPPGWP